MATEPTHSVQHEFTAEGPEELSCHEGDLVAVTANQHAEAEGWTLVIRVRSSLLQNPDDLEENTGFVPTAYLKPLAARSQPSPSQSSQQRHTDFLSSSWGNFGANNGIQEQQEGSPLRTSTLETSHEPTTSADSPFYTPSTTNTHKQPQQQDANGIQIETQPSPQFAISQKFDSGGAHVDQQLSNEFRHLFAAQEDWYQQVESRRKAAFQGLEKSVDSLNSRILNADEKSAEVVDKLKELDRLIDEERRRWQDRLEEQEQYLVHNQGEQSY